MDANLNLQARRLNAQMSVPDKLTQAMQQSVGKLPGELQQQMQQLLKPEALAVLGGVTATWGALQVVGGPAAVAADVALLGAGYAALGASAVTAAQELFEFVQEASQAQTSQQLDQAASHFAKFVSIVGVDAVAALVGSRAGRVAEDLGQLVKNSSARLGELTGEAQRLAGTLVKGGNELWQSAGQRLEKVADDLGRTLDNALESMGIQRPQAAAAGGPLPANQPMQTQGASTGAGATALQKLQQTGVSSNTIQALEQHGLNPQQLERFVNDVRKSGYEADELSKITETLQTLVERGIDLRQAQNLLKGAPQDAVRAIETLILGKGKLENPQALPEIVQRIKAAAEPKELTLELQIAAKRVEQGSRVQLGAVHDPTITPQEIAAIKQKNPNLQQEIGRGGDIVDFSQREVLQIKRVSSSTTNGVTENLVRAGKQLQGSGGELPNEGFKKIAEIHIGPNNELFKANGQKINQQITKLMNGGELKGFDGTVRIVKTGEQGSPSEILEFRVQNSRSQYSPPQTQPNKQSSLEPDNSVQIASAPRSLSEVEGTTENPQPNAEDSITSEDQQFNDSIAEKIRASRERYPLPQLRNSETVAASLTNPQSPQEVVKSVERSNPSLHDTLNRLHNVIDELDRQTLARQPQPSPTQTRSMQQGEQIQARQPKQDQMEQG